MLALVKLEGYERRRVIELSGGEQQRVALARSLAPGPRLLMLDEPLGALDRALREELMNELRAIIRQVGVTTLYVTHDQEEAFALADRVMVMRARPEAGEGGWIDQSGTPAEVYRHPATVYVARFLGFQNLLPGTVNAVLPTRAYLVATALGILRVTDAVGQYTVGQPVTLLVRPEAADVRPATETGENIVPGRLLEASFRGSYYLIRTEHAGGITLTCEATSTDSHLPATEEPLALWLDPSALTLVPARFTPGTGW
jgi:ABC-type Fe3+/spermidine/putrescine transport system ATPase subunit